MTRPETTWSDANKRYLMAHLDLVRAALVRHANEPGPTVKAPPSNLPGLDDKPAALQHVVELFGLSPFERDLLLLCAGIELEAEFGPLCAAAQGDAQRAFPTFSLALAALDGAHWSALSPGSALRYWNLIDVEPGSSLTRANLTIDERILHYLVGINHLDKSLAPLLQAVSADGPLVESHRVLADNMMATWGQIEPGQRPTLFQLSGPEPHGKRAIAAAACRRFGLTPYLLPAACLPTQAAELARLRRLWQREAALSNAALILDCDDLDAGDQHRLSGIGPFVDESYDPIVLLTTQRLNRWQRPTISFEVDKPTSSEQRRLWFAALGANAETVREDIDRIVSQFHLAAPTITAAVQDAAGWIEPSATVEGVPRELLAPALWSVCRHQARPRLDDLAERIETTATWEDLVLPDQQKNLLREMSCHVRHRGLVYERWGFQTKGNRGLGISALFAGASGTGKTMAAEVLANELQLDLYRIDLSSVVSKYIGETEKNLRQVFDAAEGGGAILLFDEADALFGKRSEVKDSHDRHANVEVSYLLQRMESFRGLAILTTNLKEALDQAFLRRLRFIVNFPFPNEGERAKIWQRVYPVETPTESLDWLKAARLNIAGGNIRNIALGAAFLAADAGQPITMGHLAEATRREYTKLDLTLTAKEIKDW